VPRLVHSTEDNDFYLPLIARNLDLAQVPHPLRTLTASLTATHSPTASPTVSPTATATATPDVPNLDTFSMTVSRPTAQRGDRLTYTIILTNTSTGNANATLTSAIPAQTAYVMDSATDGATYDAGTNRITWAGTLHVGRPVVVTFQVRIGDDVPDGTIIECVSHIDPGAQPALSQQATTRIIAATPILLPEQIVFASTRAGGHWREIYIMQADGRNRRRLTDTPGMNTKPRVSPNRNQIAFSSSRTGTFQVFIMNLDGSQPMQLTQCAADCGIHDWGPDGRILYECDTHDTCVMNADGTGTRQLLAGFGGYGSRWSPDGLRIATTKWENDTAAWEIYIVNSDGTNPRRLTHNPGIDGQPMWSPDGTKITFTRAEASGEAGRYAIFLMNADGSDVTRLTDYRGHEWPAFSPDGSKLVYMSRRDGETELYMINVDGSNERSITRRAAGYDDHPIWFATR
jgi:uncharacterized repeat protein (TIGR01451 family)